MCSLSKPAQVPHNDPQYVITIIYYLVDFLDYNYSIQKIHQTHRDHLTKSELPHTHHPGQELEPYCHPEVWGLALPNQTSSLPLTKKK